MAYLILTPLILKSLRWVDVVLQRQIPGIAVVSVGVVGRGNQKTYLSAFYRR